MPQSRPVATSRLSPRPRGKRKLYRHQKRPWPRGLAAAPRWMPPFSLLLANEADASTEHRSGCVAALRERKEGRDTAVNRKLSFFPCTATGLALAQGKRGCGQLWRPQGLRSELRSRCLTNFFRRQCPALAEPAALEQRAVYPVLAVQDGAASTHPTAVHLTMQTSNRQTPTTQNVAEMAAFPPSAGHRESLQDKRAHAGPGTCRTGHTGRGRYRDTTMQVG